MNITGKHTFEVSRDVLWNYLMDPEVLAKITPGETALELLGDDAYKSTSTIKIGPVKGTFSGKLEVVEKLAPDSFILRMDQQSKIGNGQADVKMLLQSLSDTQTELSFDGKAKLSGLIARTGQRVLSGVANSITKEVFASLEKHIEENRDAVA